MNINQEEFLKLYFDDTLTLTQLAEYYHVGTATIQRYLKANNLSRDRKLSINYDDFYIDWVDLNLSYNELASKYGCSVSKIKTFANEHGLKKTKEQHSNNKKRSVLNKYGCEYITQTEEFKNKTRETNLNKYGCEYASQSDVVKEKITQTNLERYGVISSMQLSEIQEKTKQTNLERYGAEYTFQSDEIKNKIQETMLQKYGVKNISQNIGIQKQKIETNLKKYGCAHKKQEHYDDFTLNVLSSKENLQNFINTHSDKRPTALLSELNCTLSSLLNTIKKFDLIDSIEGSGSIWEKELCDFITSLGISFNQHDRSIIAPYELDIYCPDSKIAIEADGTYWHSEIFKDKKYHLNKTLQCEKKGIRLIHIYEYEWMNEKRRNIIKSMLRIVFNKIDKRIYARDCDVRIIDNITAQPFNDTNHLQGHKNAKVTYGLFYKNELVQLMSFSYHKSKQQWEIERGCPGSNNIVVGGVSKLFTHFIRENNPERIFSYCDYNKFNGSGYEAIGMKYIGSTGPDLKYVMENNTVVNRHPGKYKQYAESSISKIWGCGSKKYLWERDDKKSLKGDPENGI